MSEPKKPSFLAGPQAPKPAAPEAPAPAAPAQPTPAPPSGPLPSFFKTASGSGAAPQPAAAPEAAPAEEAAPADPVIEEEEGAEFTPELTAPALPGAPAGGMVGIVKPLAEFPAGNRAQAEQLLVKGLDQYDHEQLDVALAFYQRAIDADLSFSMAHNSLGMVLIDLERYPEAIEAIKNAIRIDQANTEALSNLGFVYRRVGNEHQAAKAYSMYLALEPEDEQGERIRKWVVTVQESLGGKLPELDLSLAGAAPAAAPAAPAAAAPVTKPVPALPPNSKPPTKPIPLAPLPPATSGAKIAPAAPPATGAAPKGTPSAKIAPAPLPGKGPGPGSGARPSAAVPPKGSGAQPAEDLNAQELYEEMLDFFDKEDFKQVRTYAQKILEIEPTHLSTKVMEGKILTYERNYQDAVVFFANVLESAPKDPSIYYFLGYCLRALEQDMEAAEAFIKYLELMPTAVDASKTAAWIQKVTGKPMGARTAAGGVPIAGPGITQPAPIASGGSRAPAAAGIGMLEKTFVYIPSDAEVDAQEEVPEKDLKKYQRGVQAFQEGNLEGAHKYVDQFLGEHEKFSDAHVLKARILIRNREYDQAITSIQRAIQLNPASSEAYYYLGQAYEKHGKLQESRACYQRTLELEPEGPRAEHLREWLDRAQQAAAVAVEEIVCDRCLRKFESRYVTTYEDKQTCRWCLELVEAQTGGGLVAQMFPDLVREEQERDQLDPSRLHTPMLADDAAVKSNKGLLIGVAAALILILGGGAFWYFKMREPVVVVVDPIVDPGPPKPQFKPADFKITLAAPVKDLRPDEPFEAAIQIDGAQPEAVDIALELKKGCPEGTHFDADRKKVLWRSPSIIDPVLEKDENPFSLAVVAVVKEKGTSKVLGTFPASIDLVVRKLDEKIEGAKDFTWIHDEPKQLLPMEWMRWKIQGQGLNGLQLTAKILKAPAGATVTIINGQPVVSFQAPFDGTLEGLKASTTSEFELELGVIQKPDQATPFYPKPYGFKVTTGWSMSEDHEVDLKLDPTESVLLASGQLMQAPGDRPDDVVVAHGRPLREGSLEYLDFTQAGGVLTCSSSFHVKLPGFPFELKTANLFQGSGSRDDVLVTDLYRTGLNLVAQGANGRPGSGAESFGLASLPGDILAMDLNRDGKNDLVYADLHGTQVYIAMQTADGKFERTPEGKLKAVASLVDEYAAPVRLVNLKNRNRIALVSGWKQGRVKVQLLEVKAADGQPSIVPVGAADTEVGTAEPRWCIDAMRVKTADRDWLAVIAGGEKTSSLELFRPVGDALRRVAEDPKAVSSMVLPPDLDAPPVQAVADDLNRDDLDDIVIGYPHRIDIFWQVSGANAKWLLIKTIKDANLTGEFVLADIDHNGRLDVLAYDARQKLHVFLSK